MADEAKPQSVWEGPVDEEGRPHGTGIMKYAAHLAEEDEEEKPGDVYAGCMEHGVRTGRAKYTWTALGAVYDGDYVGAKKHGTGTMIYPDKGRYEGTWVDDERDGEGTYYYPSGDVFRGSWRAGKKHGPGTYHFAAQQCQFVGSWKEGAFEQGAWVHSDGTSFKGSFVGCAPSEGTMLFARSGLAQQGCYGATTGWTGRELLQAAAGAAVAAAAPAVTGTSQ